MFNFRGVLSIKKDGEIVYTKKSICKLNKEKKSELKNTAYDIKYKKAKE